MMHTQKNVNKHSLSTILGAKKTKDGLKVRKDIKKLRVNKKLWLVEDKETDTTSMPKASYELI